MFRKLVLAAAALALVTVAVPKASADSFDLNVDYCGNACLTPGGSGGTVLVTDNGGGSVTVTVSLTAANLTFHDEGLTSFSFNVSSHSTGLTAANFSGVSPSSWTFTNSPNADGAGKFEYGFSCVPAPNGCDPTATSFTFTVTASGITAADLEQVDSAKVDFAANVANSTVSGCTGVIGGGNGTSQTSPTRVGSTGGTGACTGTPVPEPTSVFLLGTALLFAGKLMKMKLLVS